MNEETHITNLRYQMTDGKRKWTKGKTGTNGGVYFSGVGRCFGDA